jgi:aminocarboxymuconate-semialdehyde decarboxylase
MSGTISTCGHERPAIPVSARGKHLVVDIHCHLAVPAAEAQIRQAIPGFAFQMPFSSPASDAVTGKLFATIGPALNGVEQRLSDMDRLGVDVQAISPSPGQYFYFTEPELGRDLARTINDGLAEAVAKHPDRLVGMGTVPLQSPELAIAEMRRCVNDLGLRGIEISSNVNGRELAEDEFRPFFAAAEELGILLFLHPLGFTHGQRLSEH